MSLAAAILTYSFNVVCSQAFYSSAAIIYRGLFIIAWGNIKAHRFIKCDLMAQIAWRLVTNGHDGFFGKSYNLMDQIESNGQLGLFLKLVFLL